MMFIEPGDTTNISTQARVETFYASAGSWSTWQAQPGETMAYFLVIGSGASGGGGMTGATATIRGGGGGGGSGGAVRCLCPLMLLPTSLYIQTGTGASEVAPATNGANGQRSFISVNKSTAAADLFLASGSAPATGGTAGSTAGSAAAGSGEVSATASTGIWSNFGILAVVAGKIGAIGGVVGGGAGAPNVILTGSQLNGGAGGGTTPAANTEFAGGAQTGAASLPTIVGGIAGGNPGNGNGGYSFFRGKSIGTIGYGGAGGGTGGAATAGNGGAGAFPGGGGGGGGGGITAGRGGRGGDGFVMIISW